MVSTRSASSKVTLLPPKASKLPSHKQKSEKKTEKKIKSSKTLKNSTRTLSKPQKPAEKLSKKVEKPQKKVEKPQKKVEKPKKDLKTAPVPTRVKKERKQPVTKPAGSNYLGYTPLQYKQYKENKEKLESYTQAELKELCRKNGQKVTGLKPELIERVADGEVLGAIPKCSSCGGGRPRWNAKSGTYECPGYMEDDEFINCRRKFGIGDIIRTPWQD